MSGESKPAPPRDKLVGQKLGNYQLERRIGAGAMGYVYVARHVGLNKQAAIKIMSPELIGTGTNVERFLREAQMAASLEHPNVVQVFDVGESNGLYYLAMQYVEGQSLDKVLHARGKLPVAEAGGMIKKVALAAAHKLGIVHRDVKPANVLLSKDGQVKVADFGLARSNDSSLSLSGQIIGTPYYMAPEQAEGKAVDARADLYALGASYYHLVTGRRVFEGDTPISIILKHVNEAPTPPDRVEPSIPPAISRLILKLLAKKPDDRFASGEDFVRAHVAAEGASPEGAADSSFDLSAPGPAKPASRAAGGESLLDIGPPAARPGAPGASSAGNRSLTSVSNLQAKDNTPEEKLKEEGKPVVGKYLLVREIQKIDDDLSVWEAENVRTNARVALRMLTGHDSDRIRAFYKLAAEGTQLKHPNILHVLECHSDTDRKGKVAHFMAVELVNGQPLKNVVASRAMSLRHLMQLGVQIAQALEFAHQRRRLNLILSPREVQVEPPSRAVVAFQDFGASRTEDARAKFEALEAAPFMAPEQVPNVDDTADASSDVYRLGALLYWMATQRAPFEAANLADCYDKILSVHPRSARDVNPEVDAELDRIIMSALRKEKRLRPAKAGDVALALQKYLRTESKEAPPSPATRRVVKTSFKERMQVAFAQNGRKIVWGLVLGALLGGGAWGWREVQSRWAAEEADVRLRRLRMDAQARYAEGKFEAALDAAQKVLEISEHDTQMVALTKACRRRILETSIVRGVGELEAAEDAARPARLAALQRAVNDLRTAIGNEPTSDDLTALVAAGFGAFATGDLEGAGSFLEKAAAMGSKDPLVGLTLARAYFARVVESTLVARMLKGSDRSAQWRILLTDAAEKPCQPPREGAEAELVGAYAALGRGEPARAKALAGAALGKGASPALAAEAKTLRAWAEGGDESADLDASLAERPGQALAYVVRALRHAEKARLPQAVADLNAAVRARPDRALLVLLRAKARQNAGDLDGARGDLARATSLAGKDWEYQDELAALERSLPAPR